MPNAGYGSVYAVVNSTVSDSVDSRRSAVTLLTSFARNDRSSWRLTDGITWTKRIETRRERDGSSPRAIA